jgi:hypothetical protein
MPPLGPDEIYRLTAYTKFGRIVDFLKTGNADEGLEASCAYYGVTTKEINDCRTAGRTGREVATMVMDKNLNQKRPVHPVYISCVKEYHKTGNLSDSHTPFYWFVFYFEKGPPATSYGCQAFEDALNIYGYDSIEMHNLVTNGKTALDVALEIVSRSTQQKLCITNFSPLIDYIDYGDDFLNGTAFRYIDEYLKTGEKTDQVIVAGDKYGYTFNQLLRFRDAGKTGRDIANEVLDRELGQRDGVSKLGQRDGVSETGH